MKKSLVQNQIDNISKNINLPRKIVELLFLRGIDSETAIQNFISNETKLYDPFLLKGMLEAKARIEKAISYQEKILIYSDYDADGVCSAAILSRFFASKNANYQVHIPSRDSDGYGLNIKTLELLIEEINPDLILTCDCGISCFEEVEFVMDLGIDIIITDHHQPPEKIPNCIVINPKQHDCSYPFKELCGAGVALKLVSSFVGEIDSKSYTDLATIATIADLVPLLDENRAIVKLGLKQIENTKSVGLKAMLLALGLKNLTSTDIAFKIAPRLNAAGRMGDARRAFELLDTGSLKRALDLIKELETDNYKRKQLCENLYLDAVKQLEEEKLYKQKSIILYSDAFEKGITGIVAAKLCGEFNRPVIIMSKSGDCYKGTARSSGGINIYDALFSVEKHLIEYGGHTQAAGFSIYEKDIPNFKLQLQEYFNKLDDNIFMPQIAYDIDILEEEIDNELIKALDLLEPFGHSNSRPLFKLIVDKLKLEQIKGGAHTVINTQKGFSIIAFSYADKNYLLHGEGKKELILELKEDTYRGKPSGILRQCLTNELYINDELAISSFFKMLNFKSEGESSFNTYTDLSNFAPISIYGTLFIAASSISYNNFLDKYKDFIILKEYIKPLTKNNFNRIIVSPEFNDELILSFYNRIVFLDSPPNEGVISFIKKRTNAQIFIPLVDNFRQLISGVDLSKDMLRTYFRLIKSSSGILSNSLQDYFNKLRLKEDICLKQFILSLTIFIDLNLLNINKEKGFSISTNDETKVELEQSKIYRQLINKLEN
ncbi:MAG: single-stranded-DNA-specific exonuclease RecJ [Firmicutes bacterium]|nr:single-stranded-DNA-specific exonuclease RecJ [Bacillota bacterium]